MARSCSTESVQPKQTGAFTRAEACARPAERTPDGIASYTTATPKDARFHAARSYVVGPAPGQLVHTLVRTQSESPGD